MKAYTKEEMVGRVFGRLTVLKELDSTFAPSGQKRRHWSCQCACGKTTKVQQSNLVRGHTSSCGCLNDEAITSHGMTHTSTYKIWQYMIQRCYNANHQWFKNYGGRGIKVCKRWRDSFENFLADMGPRPSVELSIDRIDNDGNYEPENCRWATRKEQCNNTRSIRRFTLNGITRPASEWASRLGLKSLHYRIQANWPVHKMLTTWNLHASR